MRISSSGNVGIGAVGQSQKLYVNDTTYFNGATTINSTLTTTNEIVSNAGISQFKYIYINNPDGRITHLPFAGNNENYIRGKLNIDQDALYVGGAVSFNSTLSVAGLSTIRHYANYGETVLILLVIMDVLQLLLLVGFGLLMDFGLSQVVKQLE